MSQVDTGIKKVDVSPVLYYSKKKNRYMSGLHWDQECKYRSSLH